MNRRNVIVVLLVLAATAWWFLHEDPEAEVRDAHRELTRLLSKPEGEGTGTTLINARVLQKMFAGTCEVSGDAEMLVGSYTPEEMVSTIIQVQGIFLSVDLTFHEMAIEFPTPDDALVKFTAVLVGRVKTEAEAAGETRDVVSRLQKVDGKWLFAEFRFEKMREN